MDVADRLRSAGLRVTVYDAVVAAPHADADDVARAVRARLGSVSTHCLQASDSHGFVVDEAEVVYWGLCPTCQERPAPSTAPMEESA